MTHVTYRITLSSTHDAEWLSTFKAYTSGGKSALVFEQTWLVAMSNTAGGSTFPSLSQSASQPAQLGTWPNLHRPAPYAYLLVKRRG